MTPTYWPEAKAALRKRDKVLKTIIDSYRGEAMRLRGDPFFTLARSITGQQVSVKAADSVWNKLLAALPLPDSLPQAGEGIMITPGQIAAMDAKTLRACGLSERKVMYLHGLANHFLENKQQVKNWPTLPDDGIIRELVALHGIGRWTAEMFLIFGLGRPDVFPLDDLGLLKGIHRHYNKGKPLPLRKIIAIGENWRPYRSLGTWYMWRVLDPLPVAY
ncbi:MAG: DNA-3-methyladenine glycosylase 2 family protein [Pseudomonadota bacterium]|nr:DNA-3-methyladenine glycosylase 2 family protein [Pseudomonadota bacterium]MDE3037835.1 DNA-3-methyladenine glycosylase 2 family protein [Pseudomonadota bacterium]